MWDKERKGNVITGIHRKPLYIFIENIGRDNVISMISSKYCHLLVYVIGLLIQL